MTGRGSRLLLLALLVLAGSPSGAAEDAAEWVDIDYGELVDRRQLSHSGEPVGVLLDRLGGRPLPPPGAAGAADRLRHSLLEPLLEPYAFVLQDALDALDGPSSPPLVELGPLWAPGEAQPAWVELLRARRLLAESDGKGRLRLCLPWSVPTAETPSADAARVAYAEAYPVLRLIFAAERARLGGSKLEVEVHAYLHAPERTTFRLGRTPHRVSVDETRTDGRQPPLDLNALEEFLATGLVLEGGRLERGGDLRLFGSRAARPPTLLGRPLSLADLAVAYRAVFHGGQAEPYMSLDKGFSPQTSIVNYGGRLRDTALGLVSLLCDIRFKTFSLGLDITTGGDVRGDLRRKIPGFRTHLERFAADPGSRGILGQQTRLWFYPDSVDLTVSPQGDVLAMRRVRMSAASERVRGGSSEKATGEDPPWTRATVAAINDDYDRLATFFPELSDLDRVVRLLSLFTWLEQAKTEGHLLPDMDALLGVELPPLPTPRTFPQLLTFNALPAEGEGSVDVFDQVPAAQGLERLNPDGGRPLAARRRLERAGAALDRSNAQNAALLAEIGRLEPSRLTDAELDFTAHRAERLRMHQTVLGTLDANRRAGLAQRQGDGEKLRIFSVGIGGLDLGMGQALRRSGGRRLGLGQVAGPEPRVVRIAAASGGATGRRGEETARETWRVEPPKRVSTRIPDHGASAGETLSGHRVVATRTGEMRSVWTVYGRDAPEVTSRRLLLGKQGDVQRIERVESGRLVAYRLAGAPRMRAELLPGPPPPQPEAGSAPASLPRGLATMRVSAEPGRESPTLRLRLEAPSATGPQQLEADFPRGLLQRLVMGHAADRTPERPLGALSPLPDSLGAVETLMVLQRPVETAPPWTFANPIPGEESAARLGRSLNAWWRGEAGAGARPAAVVGTDPVRSPARWASAPRVSSPAVLLLPEDAFPATDAGLRDRLAGAWSAGPVVASPTAVTEGTLVVVIGAESPALFAGRLRALSRDPGLRGKLLAGWCLSGPVRGDLPATLLAESQLGGFGVARSSLVAMRRAVEEVAALAGALRADPGARRAERLPGPFVWYF